MRLLPSPLTLSSTTLTGRERPVSCTHTWLREGGVYRTSRPLDAKSTSLIPENRRLRRLTSLKLDFWLEYGVFSTGPHPFATVSLPVVIRRRT